MDIVSSTAETLDVFIEKIHANQKEAVTKALENYDKQLYSSIDHKRFELIRLDERTILSSFGILKFKRRYYYDNDMDEYVYLLDNQLQIPKSV